MKWLDKLDRKLGRFAIRNLMLYIVIGTAVVYFLCLFNTDFAYFLMLDPQKVFEGQIWRVVTWVFVPHSVSFTSFLSVLISLYFYFFIGRLLENQWGAFRFNVYYFLGVILSAATSLITGQPASNSFLNESLFLAFATLMPDLRVLLFFFIPIRVRWLGLVAVALLIYQFIIGDWAMRFMIIASLANYAVFFLPMLIEKLHDLSRRRKWQAQFNAGKTDTKKTSDDGYNGPVWSAPRSRSSAASSADNVRRVAFHRCVICGKTELDDPNMQFRYCSECSGAMEYCMEHLKTHIHVTMKQEP